MTPHLRIRSLFLWLSCFCVFAQSADDIRLPNFEFPDGKSLQDHVSSKGLVLVYGDSGCPAYQQAQSHLKIRHKRWREWGFSIVYIALDSDPKNLQ